MTANIQLHNVQKRNQLFAIWEKHRHPSVVECFAEFLGVFFYVYAGVGSQVSFTIGSTLKIDGLGSILQIGFSYAFGIVLAIGICGSTSGGHFNPSVTIAMMVHKGFPPIKALRYIISQIFGGYIACLLIYAQYHDLIKASEAALASAGNLESVLFTPTAPAGAFGLYPFPGLSLGRIFLNEFVTDMFLGLVIHATMDPTNVLITPQIAPFVTAMAYASAIWGYAAPTLAANPARDIGGRLAAMTIWGKAASGGSYAAIAALTSIPATMFGALLYELFLTDSSRAIPAAHREHLFAHRPHVHNATPFEASSVELSGVKHSV